MCLAVPIEILEIEDDMATGRVGEGDATIQTSLMLLDEQVDVGDWIIVHAGFALRKLDPQEARETLKILRDIVRLTEEAGIQQDML
ncbi:HypC/HybG/HupF family hydrogenase formation chaperone [Pseudodesulfovibrio senegalensis]|jgi:hydrogenase expression/formation protein HypC|uniref:HypC/HybG/HupF family hydrogenase formation chaperone n=1 Tax=Pseudodesulfovibrio senegalensis TaxID=1721087 RepID=A0A6N6N361_9BACT|nr:HypC/HybG/HupF family hydrogenase formation chaperone [Pseudodesulfovibrio senegalensis]KAB1442265.1 HypC/HybG/HupF family hydrogenase formation chaperone [Pseudodesulfovibrio senegalensis]